MTPPSLTAYAERAALAHAALRRRFERPDGMLRRDGALHRPGAPAHLWPLARAFVAALDLGEDDAVIESRRSVLERYWDARAAAYASDPPGGRVGGDVYYDDNAWVGLGLVQYARGERVSAPDAAAARARAAEILAFARAGWSRDPALPHPGGIVWVEQGRGVGARNHDRNAVSTAPNAELALQLGEAASAGDPSAAEMAGWVTDALANDDGLIRDKVRGDGTLDRALWSYNQGSMIGLRALLGEVSEAEALASSALDHYAATGYAAEPAAFVAIFVRNLLVLHARSEREPLRERIRATLRERADAAWAATHALGRRRATLLDVSALVSLQALVAWDPEDYGRLA